ncbi:amidase [Nocardia terpenica]|uniref:amidase n=1 Tax=Nocardia terpenica TaxID=455432 RepID=UPI0018948F63|nr:amidase [Nocardia terpenica]MBF6063416.1 amidase [Nocardia terpenica]MBF6105972.1 amidase [Nocardia terpenica]MBF6113443.1 amidase [Nocardia terpenica]MBF6119713.1 amidase [Nocardia terpenica]MBF6152124.1 amidase [Nocardia terpenica]
MTGTRLHAFTDDALGTHDAVALAELVATGAVSAEELAEAAIARARRVDPVLRAVAYDVFDAPRYCADKGAALYGIPTFIKDHSDLVGMPTSQGSRAVPRHAATRDDAYARQALSSGVTVLGKSRLPEFGLNASTEFAEDEPARNPWHTDYSVGGSTGGGAALVAAGVVPIAHATDGGGSIRIPAAAAGLVGLKPTRGRHVVGAIGRTMPLNIVSENVVTRTVRDTAHYLAAIENHWRNPKLPPIGLVLGPARRRLRVALLIDTPIGTVDEPTRAAVERTAALLEDAGHVVEPIAPPVGAGFVDDFLQYWTFLADLLVTTGKSAFGKGFDPRRVDPFTRGLRNRHRARLIRTPGALRRLFATSAVYARAFDRHEVILSPVVAHTTPKLGYLSPTQPFDTTLDRLVGYAGFTPVNNATGTPSVSLPMGRTAEGLPIGVMLSAARGDERTLLESAYTLEAAQPFPSITAE